MTWLPWPGSTLCALLLMALGLLAYAAKRRSNRTRSLFHKLEAGRIDPKANPALPRRYDARELDGLPAPVQRYFHTVLSDGQPIITAATIELTGVINLSATGERWSAFTSRQRIITRRPGFLWNARVSLLPGLAVRAIDSYIAGKGLLRAAVLGWLTVADVEGPGEIARGEFMRFFAEAAWYPTALLPSQGVRWQAVDAHSAKATIDDGPFSLTMLFRFDDAGLIASFHAEARGALIGKDMYMLPWEGRWSNYKIHAGMTVPFSGEVAWLRPEGRKSYFRGSVSALNYEFSS